MEASISFDEDLHAQVRGLERYGVFASEADLDDMVLQVQQGRGMFLFKKSKSVSVWVVYWPAIRRVVPVIYGKGRIKTILPMDIWSHFRVEGAVAGDAASMRGEAK